MQSSNISSISSGIPTSSIMSNILQKKCFTFADFLKVIKYLQDIQSILNWLTNISFTDSLPKE